MKLGKLGLYALHLVWVSFSLALVWIVPAF